MICPSSSSEDVNVPAAAFARLHKHVQAWIWAQKWHQLRSTQAEAVDPILRGNTDVIISAPTASGKTEAAWLPILSALAEQKDSGPVPTGVKALYLSPLKALINDQYGRLESLAESVGMPVHRRHGDVTGGARKALRETPDGLLLITPESLEAMFVTQGTHLPGILNGLQYIVVDEMHSFIGTERGAQLQSLLHRVELALRRRIPRIGLSATLADLTVAAEFLRPKQGAAVQLIGENSDDKAELRMQLRGYIGSGPASAHTADEEEFDAGVDKKAIAEHLFRNLRGQDNLVFANSRSNVETYADLLKQISERNRVVNEFFPHHGNLSKEFREDVESRLRASGTPATAVCTSTLEMGIDIGSADTVVQIGAPGSVSALRQRLGRSGRRGGAATLRLYVSEQVVDHRTPPVDQLRAQTFETVATIELLLERWYEPPNTNGLHLSTLIQQVLSVIAQHGGATAAEIYGALCEEGPFGHVDRPMFIRLLRGLGEEDLIMQASDGTLLPGGVGERLVNHYSFYSAFQSAEEYRLITSGRTLGSIPIDHPVIEGNLLIFAGRRWRVLMVDTANKVIDLAQARGGRPPAFSGGGAEIADGIRQRMRLLYEGEDIPAYLDLGAQTLLSEGRSAYKRMNLAKQPLISWGDDIILFPWAGDRIMNTLHVLLTSYGLDVSLDGVALNLRKTSPEQLGTLLRKLATSEKPEPPALAKNVAVKNRDKHDMYLDDGLLTLSYAASSLDIDATWPVLRRLSEACEASGADPKNSEVSFHESLSFPPGNASAERCTVPFAVVDVETTGFSAQRERIVEIAIVRLDATGVISTWSTLINPDRPTGPVHIHGIRPSDVVSAPRFAEVLDEIAQQLAGAVVVAHNASFDISFLNNEFARAGVQAPSWPTLCTMQLSKKSHPNHPATLAETCRRLNIEAGEAHTALGDATATAQVLMAYVERSNEMGSPDLFGLPLLPVTPPWNPSKASGRTPVNTKQRS